MSAIIVLVLMLILFLILGIVFGKGKGQDLIAGYNTASEKERAKIDEKKLMKLMSRGMFAFAGCMLISVIGVLRGNKAVINAGFCLMMAGVIALVILANTKTKR